MQSAATFHVQRQLSARAAGTLAYSYAAAQGGLGLEVGVQRALSEHSKGHLTWNVGPVGGLTTGAQRAKGKTSCCRKGRSDRDPDRDRPALGRRGTRRVAVA
jgi:hypothetical protein